MDSKTQTALITGASGGIGYELAKLFARDHYDLVLVARRSGKLNQVAAELQGQFGVGVKTVALDLVASPASEFLFDQLGREGVAVDVLVNNAGFGGFGEFAAMTEEADFSQHYGTHSSDPAFSSGDAGAARGQDHECGFYCGFSAGAVDGRLLRDQGLRAFVLGGAGERSGWLGRSGELFLSGSHGYWFREAGWHGGFAAVQETPADECGSCGAGRLPAVDGGADSRYLGFPELAGGGVGAVWSAGGGDGGL